MDEDPEKLSTSDYQNTERALFHCVGSDIAGVIMSNLCDSDAYASGQANIAMLGIFKERMQNYTKLIAQMQNTDVVRKTLMEQQHCCLDDELLSKQLRKIPCYLSKQTLHFGAFTSVQDVFPKGSLNKMKTDNQFKIIRLFDAGANKNYLKAISR